MVRAAGRCTDSEEEQGVGIIFQDFLQSGADGCGGSIAGINDEKSSVVEGRKLTIVKLTAGLIAQMEDHVCGLLAGLYIAFFIFITQTSHTKKWVRTLKNQYFSSQNSTYAAS